MTSLGAEEHHKVQKLCLEHEKGDEQSKQVFIRDQLDDIFGPYFLKWRLMPKQIGIHPCNRDQDEMTASGVWIRGSRINASGFSFKAIGKVWGFEDHPTKQHIAKHTMKVTTQDPKFASFDAGEIKVGPANWTHSNQFVCMVIDRAMCDHPEIPTLDGRIDKDMVLNDPKNTRMKEYVKDGMVVNVFPYWVEETYPCIPKIFQSACNQEQQVQEGVCVCELFSAYGFET
jgi:hypothetical protein